MTQKLDHKHIIVTASGLQNPLATAELMEQWLIALVSLVDMNILMGPYAIRCSDVGNEGVTGIVVISTSHLSVHCWDSIAEPFLKMDLYSCKDFDPEVVLTHIGQFLPKSIDWILIDRNSKDMPIIDRGHRDY